MFLLKFTVEEFITKAPQVWSDLEENFKIKHGYNPSPSELNSWKNSLPQLANVLRDTSPNTQKALIYLEYSMPGSSSRADAIIIGLNSDLHRGATIVELKQWDANSIMISGENLKIGGQIHNHPSDQALGYREYLTDLSTAFADTLSVVKSCSYLHNTISHDVLKLKTASFSLLTDISPLFSHDEHLKMTQWISDTIKTAPDSQFVAEFDLDKVKVSKKLFDTVAKAVHDEPSWKLLDDQRTVVNLINNIVYQPDNEKHLILVSGGPGTGKSVIAMQVMGDLSRKRISCVHVTNSSSFTTVMKSLIRKNRDRIWGTSAVNGLFKLSHNWVKNKPEFEVAICDEAHRFRKSTNLFQQGITSTRPQAEEILENVRVMIAFIDEKQRLRKAEEGTIEYFKAAALKVGVLPQNIHGPFELTAQFRSAGNEDFIKSLDKVLYEDEAANFSHRNFEFNVQDTVEDLEEYLKDKIDAGDSARMVAGFCWPWSDPDHNGSLIPDVSIENWSRPWNRKAVGGETPQNHPYTIWATRLADQLSEIGCIYSVQGFEFDYVGVIWGDDLVWRHNKWVAQPDKSFDKEMKKRSGSSVSPNEAIELLKNSYRVLSSRGMKGCSIYCVDEETGEHLKTMLDDEM